MDRVPTEEESAFLKKVRKDAFSCPSCGSTVVITGHTLAPEEDLQALASLKRDGLLGLSSLEEMEAQWLAGTSRCPKPISKAGGSG